MSKQVRLKIARCCGALGAAAALGPACLLLSGCGARPTALHAALPIPVRVSLAQIAQTMPGWSGISQLDQAARAAQSQLQPVPMPKLPVATGVTALNAGGKITRAGVNGGSLGVSRTQAALTEAHGRVLTHIRERLARETDELVARFAAAQQVQVTAGVEQARQQAIAKYNDSLQSLLGPIAVQRVNLNLQITALGVNARPTNPPTAPDGYWQKLLDQRKAALDKLPAPQTVAQRAALEQISSQVATARAALQQSADTQTASYRTSLVERNRQILSRQGQGFVREQTDLLTIASDLNRQLDSSLLDPASVSAAYGGADAAQALPLKQINTVMRNNQDMASALANSYFAAQRRRLTTQLLDSTQRSAAHAAAQLNYKIVDWNAAQPDTEATARLLARMRLNSATGA